MIISIDVEKPIDKIQHPFMIKKKKANSESGHRRNLAQLIKAMYDEPTASIILNGEKLKPFPLR